MEINIYTVLYTLGIGLLGYFLRDIYNFTKKKLIKGDKPKTIQSYSWFHHMTSGTYPRRYTFVRNIFFKNIDTEPIYDIFINQIENGKTIQLKFQENLNPNEEVKIENKLDIPYGDTGSNLKEAEQRLPEEFKNPQLFVEYKRKTGHKFKSKFKRKEIQKRR